jgi:glycerophosphoryl diester phosphodiesterase
VTLRTRARRRVGRIYHRLQPFKHVENSLRGIKLAVRGGYDAIDIDLQMTHDGVIVATHWGRPLAHDGFHDPEGKIPRYRTVRRMTWLQVSRLLSGHYRIRRIERILRTCGRRKITAVLEPKGDKRFTHDWPWQYIAEIAEEYGATVSVRALPENSAALPAARRAGFQAWEIN